jgi:hypothetical protein
MTPMQALKNQFDSFKNILPDCFKELSLNKSESDSFINYDGDILLKKGVKSDFIKTFKVKFNDENSYSIGFSFTYIGMREEKQKVKVSIKVGNREPYFLVGKEFNVQDFNDRFKEVIKEIEVLTDKNHLTIVDIITKSFNLKSDNRRTFIKNP